MDNVTDFMLDLESFGTTAGCVVPSVAIIPFCLASGEVAEARDSFVENISVQDQLEKGRRVDSGALEFWLTHPSVSESARADLFIADALSIERFTEALNHWVRGLGVQKDDESIRVWAKPSSFDWPLLEGLIGQDNMPWHRRCCVCVRTACLGAQPPNYTRAQWKKQLIAHDPYDDCILQIKELLWAHERRNALGLRTPGGALSEQDLTELIQEVLNLEMPNGLASDDEQTASFANVSQELARTLLRSL